jgi:eukaryotic-like serine/threonine-protein kinase
LPEGDFLACWQVAAPDLVVGRGKDGDLAAFDLKLNSSYLFQLTYQPQTIGPGTLIAGCSPWQIPVLQLEGGESGGLVKLLSFEGTNVLKSVLKTSQFFSRPVKTLPGIILFRFEGCEIDPAARSLKRDGQQVSVNSKTFDLLLYLAEHPQKVITKEELLAAVWPGAFVDESNLTQHIFLLRKVLAGGNSSIRMVVTVPGKGYQFTAAVEKVSPQAANRRAGDSQASNRRVGDLVLHSVESVTRVEVEEETEDEKPIQPALTAPRKRHGRLILALVAASVVLITAGSILGWRRLHPLPAGHLDLVLSDFENGTGDRDFEHVLNQALVIDLEQSPFLNLLSRSRVRETMIEMQRKNDEALTPTLALEVCERNNAQAMLHGTIENLGRKYLLFLDADDCVSGKQIAGYKAEVASKEEVLHALDSAAGQVRQQLGESVASLERYQIPITQATTPSLEALRTFSEAGESFRHGDMKAAQILLNRATELDPNFASAYRALGSTYYNLGDYNEAANFYKKAFDLREHTTERERLGIEVMYYGYGMNNYEESIRRTKQLLQIYPNATNSWVSLSNLYTRLGEHGQAIDAAEQAHRLDPQSSVATVELARSYLRASRFADAKSVARMAIAEGEDHWDVHSILFQIAYAEHDAAAMKAEGEWGLAHQHANTSLYDLALAAATAGKLKEAGEDFSRARSVALRDGEKDFAEGVLLRAAHVQMDLDEPALAAASLNRMKGYQGDPSDPGERAYLKGMIGEAAFAEHFAAAAASGDSGNTVITGIYVPLVRALLAVKSHKPDDAVRLLEPARVYQMRDFTIPYFRAQAESEAGLLDPAIADYRLILANQGVDPISPEYPLSHLGLARVLARQNKIEMARDEYRAFLDAWKDADSNLPQLQAAKQEFASLK